MFVSRFINYNHIDNLFNKNINKDNIKQEVLAELIHQNIINKVNLLNQSIFVNNIEILDKNEILNINNNSVDNTRVIIFGVPDSIDVEAKAYFNSMRINVKQNQYLLIGGGEITISEADINNFNWCIIVSFISEIPDKDDVNYKNYLYYCNQLKYIRFKNLNLNLNCLLTIGEIIDRHSILKLKFKACHDDTKTKIIGKMIDNIDELIPSEILMFYEYFLTMIGAINKNLWDLEDRIRVLDKNNQINQEFIDTSRNIIKNNDLRAETKKKINNFFSSEFHDFKFYNQTELIN